MTALGKTRDEVGAMPFCDVSDLFKFWRKNPPAHILLGIMAQEKVWKPRSEEPVMMDTDMAALAGRNRVPLSKMPTDAAAAMQQMFADLKSGKLPVMEQ